MCTYTGAFARVHSRRSDSQVDFDDVSGELLLPYVSEDVTWEEMELKLTAKEGSDPRCVCAH